MAYMMNRKIEMLQVRDAEGVIWCHYHQPPAGDGQARTRGPRIDYIGPQYLQRWLDLGLVTEIVGDEPKPEPRPEPAPIPPSDRYRMTGAADALWVTGPDGRQAFHIADPVIAASTHGANGPVIEWISADQASVYLAQGYITRIGAAHKHVEPAPAPADAGPEWARQVQDSDGRSLSSILGAARAAETVELAPVANGGLVEECLADLARLDVALDSGAPTCRKVLRDNRSSYSNEVIAAAVKQRRARAALAGTATTP
jgi:hypothetical protein